MSNETLDLDTPRWGAKALAEVAGRFNEDGTPDERAGFYLIPKLGDAVKKIGRQHVFTPRNVLQKLGALR